MSYVVSLHFFHRQDKNQEYVLQHITYILMLFCFARMDFSDQYCTAGETWDGRCHEKFISSKTYQQ